MRPFLFLCAIRKLLRPPQELCRNFPQFGDEKTLHEFIRNNAPCKLKGPGKMLVTPSGDTAKDIL
jgi:hypothetical protein